MYVVNWNNVKECILNKMSTLRIKTLVYSEITQL